MIEKIQNLLRKHHIDTFLIHESISICEELYLIKKESSIHRINNLKNCELTIYRDFDIDEKKMRGSASCMIDHCMNDNQIEKNILSCYEAAKTVKNPFYELPTPALQPSTVKNIKSNSYSLSDMKNALYRKDTSFDAFINSSELFISNVTHNIINSNGICVTYSEKKYHGEFVVQSKTPHDVELYRDFCYDSSNDDILDCLENLSIQMLNMVRDRAKALKYNAADAKINRIILEGPYVYDLFRYFVDRANASMIYPKYSDFSIGKSVISETSDNDAKFSITINPIKPYTTEGITLKKRALITNNILNYYPGNAQFSYYLQTTPKGVCNRFILDSSHTVSFAECNEPYLRIVNFSDFQMDVYSGQFGGEFRLAYYYDSQNEYPVTNGSISGNILDIIQSISFSKETQKLENYFGPKSISYSV